MSWSYSRISSNWKGSTTMAPNGEKIVVFASHVWEVNSDGICNQAGSDWPNTVAATTNGNFIYAIRPDGSIYKLRTSNYTVSKWIDAVQSESWSSTRSITVIGNYAYLVNGNKLFAYDISLTIVDTDTGETTVVHSNNWHKILTGCATSSTMYAVFDSEELWK
ncbi:12649_t:CDS:2, partial [Dentiscutata heterogama]